MDAKGKFRFEADETLDTPAESVQERLDRFEANLKEYTTGIQQKLKDKGKDL